MSILLPMDDTRHAIRKLLTEAQKLPTGWIVGSREGVHPESFVEVGKFYQNYSSHSEAAAYHFALDDPSEGTKVAFEHNWIRVWGSHVQFSLSVFNDRYKMMIADFLQEHGYVEGPVVLEVYKSPEVYVEVDAEYLSDRGIPAAATLRKARPILTEARESTWLGRWWLLPDGEFIDIGSSWTTHAAEALTLLPEMYPNDPDVLELLDEVSTVSDDPNDRQRVEAVALDLGWIRGYDDGITVPTLDSEVLNRLRVLLPNLTLGDTVYLDIWDQRQDIKVEVADLMHPRMTPEALLRRAERFPD